MSASVAIRTGDVIERGGDLLGEGVKPMRRDAACSARDAVDGALSDCSRLACACVRSGP